jgi:putative hydrolase of the HAD superfamily
MSDKPAIRVLLLDIGGVLLTNGWDRRARHRAAEVFGLEEEDMNERHHLTFDTYESGKISLATYLKRVVFHKPRPFTVQEFRQFMFDQSRPYPDMTDLVSRLGRRHGVNVGAVSNEGRELAEYRIQHFALTKFMQFFVASCFVHIRKPDEDIYRLALDVAHVEPQHAVYVDDRAMFVEVAAAMGIHSIHHTGYDSTRAALAELGLVE